MSQHVLKRPQVAAVHQVTLGCRMPVSMRTQLDTLYLCVSSDILKRGLDALCRHRPPLLGYPERGEVVSTFVQVGLQYLSRFQRDPENPFLVTFTDDPDRAGPDIDIRPLHGRQFRDPHTGIIDNIYHGLIAGMVKAGLTAPEDNPRHLFGVERPVNALR